MIRVLSMFAAALLMYGCSTNSPQTSDDATTSIDPVTHRPVRKADLPPEIYPPARQGPAQPGIGEALCWSQLPGWKDDPVEEALPAILAQCKLMTGKDPAWEEVCEEAPFQAKDSAHAFIQSHFLPHRIYNRDGGTDGLFTGYYEPILHGSLTPDSRYRYPLYKRPTDLVNATTDPSLANVQGKRARGRLVKASNGKKKMVPYYSRAEIDGPGRPLKGKELVWVDDPDDAFFLHVQGSGRVQLTDGSLMAVGYADQNGHPYKSIGRWLVDNGYMTLEEVSMQSIRQWLQDHPKEAQTLRNRNPSYVFFYQRDNVNEGPKGSMNIPLTPVRSAAVDRTLIPLGTPLWIDTVLPGDNQPFQRLLMAQDTGGAINGPVRADVFWGQGERAEKMAGDMKQPGTLYAFLPRKADEKELCRR